MTYKEKDAYLRRYIDSSQRLYGLALEAERWREIGAIVSAPSGEPSGQTMGGGKVQSSAVRAADIVRDISEDISQAREERKYIKRIIRSVGNRRKELLLSLRYINGLSVDDVANEIGKSTKWTREALKKAVDSIEIPEK